MIVAADHPARGALGVGDAPAGDGQPDRACWSGCVLALARPGVDGVLATPDILEDLLLLGALEDKVVIGSMNRGGLPGARFELDDRFTGYDARRDRRDAASTAARCSAGIDLDDPGTVTTLERCARAVNELAGRGLMAMVEPFCPAGSTGRSATTCPPTR